MGSSKTAAKEVHDVKDKVVDDGEGVGGCSGSSSSLFFFFHFGEEEAHHGSKWRKI